MNVRHLKSEPCLAVGIVSGREIRFSLPCATRLVCASDVSTICAAASPVEAAPHSSTEAAASLPIGNPCSSLGADSAELPLNSQCPDCCQSDSRESASPCLSAGAWTARLDEGCCQLNGPDGTLLIPICGSEVCRLENDRPAGQAAFQLEEVCIGIGFHWQRLQRQAFEGSLRLVVENHRLTAVNCLPLERYLYSVIASEMKATASVELLKAHAVISRSWLLANLMRQPQKVAEISSEVTSVKDTFDAQEEHIVWYERDAHRLYDVCADDHCQRYQGICHSGTHQVKEALAATRGLVLSTDDGDICDARFYKCCGGFTERFSSCWDNRDYPYLQTVSDLTATNSKQGSHLSGIRSASGSDGQPLADNDARSALVSGIGSEDEARHFILSRPAAWCHTDDQAILSQVLNDYDRETADFFRWQVQYTGQELSDLVRRKSGMDFGRLLALEPVERSQSGRLVRLRLVGTRRTLVVGKELEIRKWLSDKHLYSSAFVVSCTYGTGQAVSADGKSYPVPETFRLDGAGWGHGVGLCQIGAAVMAAKGLDHRQILAHYYPGARLEKLY